MTPELDEKLCKDFPLLYADRYADMRGTAMCWGFEVDNGWFSLIYELSAKLEKLIEQFIEENYDMCFCYHSIKDHNTDGCTVIFEKSKFNDKEILCDCETFHVWHPKASQVKEKYGSLRCYLTSGTDKMFELISEAEEQSCTICETCGNAGQLMATDNNHPCGWLKTLCFKCVETNEFYKKQLYAPVADEQQ